MNSIIKKAKVNVAALIAMLMIVPASVFAQNRVTGTVRDANNAPIEGVSIVVPGTTVATTTNRDGNYSIAIPANAQQSLTFTAIGFTSRTVQVGTRTVVNVSLDEGASAIDEVVVVGYGTMRKSDVTGSLSSVKINDTEAAGTTSFDRLLQGRAAGVQVTSGSSAPGGAVEIKIRGTSSFNSSSEPLYVVDGIIMSGASQDTPQIGGVNNYNAVQNPLATIATSDIRDIQVLKDASATAIYGAQGANGVVLITTKMGTSEKPKIDYSSTYQFSKRSKTLPMLDLYGYAAWRNEVGSSRINPDTCVGVNWQDYSTRTAFSNTQRISVSGKTDKASYLVSGSYANNNGVIKQTGLSVGTLRVNFDNTVSKSVKVGSRSNFSYIVNNMTQGTEPNGTWQTSMIRQMLNYQPYFQKGNQNMENTDEELTLEGPQTWLQQYEDRSRDYRITPSVYAEVNIIKGLSFRSTLGFDYRRKIRTNSYGLGLYQGGQNTGLASVSTIQSLKYNLDNMFNYTYRLGKYGNISGVAGMSLAYSYAQNSATMNTHFPVANTPAYLLSAIDWGSDAIIMGTYRSANDADVFSQPKYALLSFLGRAVYSYRERYILTATMRVDGTSKFKEGHKFDYFPSFAFAWRASEESFIKQIKAINNLKFRLGWGRVGNQGSVSPYQTLSTYTGNGVNYALPGGGYEKGVYANVFANPYLIWEIAEQWNAGLDLSIFKNRLNVTFDYYIKNTKSLLQNITMPPSSGYDRMWVNRGNILNRGKEISVDGTPIQTKSFTFTLGGNISINRNKITDTGMPPGQFGAVSGRGFVGPLVTNSTYMKKPGNIFIEGYSVPMFYGFKTKGIVQTWDVADAPVGFGNPNPSVLPGEIYYVDQNDDGVIDDKDLTIIGNPNPKFTGGFFFSFNYKNLALDINFNGVYGNDILNGNLIIENSVSTTKNIRSDAYFKAWRADAPSNAYPGLNSYLSPVPILDRYIEDGSFLRLSNVTLSYRFKIKRIAWIKGVNISVSGNNLLLFTNYSGWDPEVNSFSYDPMRVGIDWGSYPGSRSLIFGLGLTF